MSGYKAKQQVRNLLVIIFFIIIAIAWLIWQKNVWQKNLTQKTNDSSFVDTQKINSNISEIKSEVKKSYQQWQAAKQYFSEKMNSQQASSSTSSINVDPAIIEKIKEKISQENNTDILINQENYEKTE